MLLSAVYRISNETCHWRKIEKSKSLAFSVLFYMCFEDGHRCFCVAWKDLKVENTFKSLQNFCVSSPENKQKNYSAHFFINSHNCMWAKEIKKYGYPAHPIFKKKIKLLFFKIND